MPVGEYTPSRNAFGISTSPQGGGWEPVVALAPMESSEIRGGRKIPSCTPLHVVYGLLEPSQSYKADADIEPHRADISSFVPKG